MSLLGTNRKLNREAVHNERKPASSAYRKPTRPAGAPRRERAPAARATPLVGPQPLPRRAKARRGRSPRGPLSAHIEKRPPRARRPALPQPRAAVLSAKAGLTAGFGMGPGDPRLCGRARGGRSPAAQMYSSLPGTPSPGRPWRPHGGHGSKMTHRARCFHRGCEELGLLVPLG